MLLLIAALSLQAAPFEVVIQAGHQGVARAVSFSPDGKLIATGGEEPLVRVWTLGGTLLRTIKTGQISGLGFLPDSQHIVVAAAQAIQRYSIDGAPVGASFPCQYGNLAVAKNGTVAAGCYQEALVIAPDGTLQARLPAQAYKHSFVAITDDGKRIASTSYGDDSVVHIYNGKLERVRDLQVGGDETLQGVAFVPGSDRIVVGAESKGIYIIDGNGKVIKRITQSPKPYASTFQTVHNIAFSPDGSKFAVAIGDVIPKTVALYSKDGAGLGVYDWKELMVKSSYRDTVIEERVESVAFSADSKILAIAGNTAGHFLELHDWQRDRGAINRNGDSARPMRIFERGAGAMMSVTASVDGSRIAAFDDDANIWIFDADLRLERGWRWEKGHASKSISMSADGRQVLTSSPDSSAGAQLWSVTGQELGMLTRDPRGASMISPTSREYVTSGLEIGSLDGGKPVSIGRINGGDWLAWNADGASLACAGDNRVKLLHNRSLAWQSDIPTGKATGVAISPDGARVAVTITLNRFPSDPRKLADVVYVFDRSGNIETRFTSEDGVANAVAFSPDGNTLAVGSRAEGDIKLYSLSGGTTRTLVGHFSGVNALVWPVGGKTLISASSDRTVRVWNPQSGEHVALLASGQQWISFTSDGYFDASANGGGLITLTRGREIFGIEQMAVRYNRPDVLLQRVGAASPEVVSHYRTRWQTRLRKAGVSEADVIGERALPTAEITSTARDGTTLTLSGRCSESSKTYNVYVNDVALWAPPGRAVSATISERVPLTGGSNKVELSCVDGAGVESLRALTAVDLPTQKTGDLWYLGFGVSKYSNSALDLGFAAKDAADLGAAFERMKGFGKVHTRVLKDSEVTVAALRSAKAFLSAAKPEDTFVLFIAGHGVHDRDAAATYYYLTHEADVANLGNTAAAFETIEDLLQGVAPRRKLFLMDTCESGEAEPMEERAMLEAAVGRGLQSRGLVKVGVPRPAATLASGAIVARAYLLERDRYIYNDLARRSGAIVFSSSRGGQLSYESNEIKNGYFTHAILDAFSGRADANKDHRVSTDELRTFVSTEVAKQTNALQTPVVDRDNLTLRFAFPSP